MPEKDELRLPAKRAVSERALKYNQILGEYMKACIASKGFSAREVARNLGTDHTTLFNYTSGKRLIPVSVVIDVCSIIGSDPVELFTTSYTLLGPPEGS